MTINSNFYHKKKVAFIVQGLNAGGTENYLLRFLRYYQEDIEATVYCKSGILGELENEFREIHAQLIPFHLGYISLIEHINLKKEFQIKKYDSVCDLTGSFGALPLLMAKWSGIEKRVSFFRSSKERFQKNFLKTKYNQLTTSILPKISTKILSNSIAALNYFYGSKWNDNHIFETVYNGVDSTKFLEEKSNLFSELDIPRKAFVIGHVGRYNKEKNHDTAIKVAIELCLEYDDIFFIFCGKNVKEVYAKTIKEKRLSNKIKFLGVRRDVNKVLNTLNCFYFPSIVEGQPNALIEALIVGLPFVASNIDSIKETVPMNFYGQLIPPMEVKLAKKKIIDIKHNIISRKNFDLSQWAIDSYNPEKCFSRFYENL